MKDTVFSPSFGNRPGKLVGRDEIISQYLAGMQDIPGSKERAVVFLGQRGSGKTVLLLELAELAQKEGYVVASPTITAPGMLERIVEKIQDEGESFLKKHKVKLQGGSLGAFGFSAGLQFSTSDKETKSFTYKLIKLCEAINSKKQGVLILIDEVQANSADLKELIIAYQELVGKGANVAIAFAGLPGAVSGTLNDKVLTFLNRAKKVELGPLKTGEIDAYYQQAFRQIKIKVPADICLKAAEATQGSPYLMQLIGHYLTVYASENRQITEKVFFRALESAKKEYISDICETTLHTLSEVDIRFLKAMAEDTENSRVSEIAKKLNVSPDYVQIYKRRLTESGVIRQPARGRLAFAIPYLHDYLREELFPEDREFLSCFQSLSESQKKRLLVYMKELQKQ